MSSPGNADFPISAAAVFVNDRIRTERLVRHRGIGCYSCTAQATTHKEAIAGCKTALARPAPGPSGTEERDPSTVCQDRPAMLRGEEQSPKRAYQLGRQLARRRAARNQIGHRRVTQRRRCLAAKRRAGSVRRTRPVGRADNEAITRVRSQTATGTPSRASGGAMRSRWHGATRVAQAWFGESPDGGGPSGTPRGVSSFAHLGRAAAQAEASAIAARPGRRR